MPDSQSRKTRTEARLALQLAEYFRLDGTMYLPHTQNAFSIGPDGRGMILESVPNAVPLLFDKVGEYEKGSIVSFGVVLDVMRNSGIRFPRIWPEVDLHLVFINAMMLRSAAHALSIGYDNGGFPIGETVTLSQSLH